MGTKHLLTTFHDFLMHHFKKKVKSHVFLKSDKNAKYIVSNTALSLSLCMIYYSHSCISVSNVVDVFILYDTIRYDTVD